MENISQRQNYLEKGLMIFSPQHFQTYPDIAETLESWINSNFQRLESHFQVTWVYNRQYLTKISADSATHTAAEFGIR